MIWEKIQIKQILKLNPKFQIIFPIKLYKGLQPGAQGEILNFLLFLLNLALDQGQDGRNREAKMMILITNNNQE